MRLPLISLLVLAIGLAWPSILAAQSRAEESKSFRVMTFNILEGGGDARHVGFANDLFGGSRLDEIAAVIRQAGADIVGIQEDSPSDKLLRELGAGWHRVGSVYSRFPLQAVRVAPFLTVVDVELPGARRIRVVNCHWHPARGFGPFLAQEALQADPPPADLAAWGESIAERCAVPGGPRGYRATIEPLRDAMEAGMAVILTGDFNEPSHLDWTDDSARPGPDRWVENPTGTPLRFAVCWRGSAALADLGMIDSFRAVHADEVKTPGNTWTPAYSEGAPGRRPYGDQVLDRIDRIYHRGPAIEATGAAVVGESETFADIVYKGPWPSDHRGVVVDYRWQD